MAAGNVEPLHLRSRQESSCSGTEEKPWLESDSVGFLHCNTRINRFRKRKTQDGAHEPECKHIRQTTAYKKRHSRSESLFHSLARCWTSCAGDSTTKAACAGDFTTKLCLHHEGSLFCIQIKHWRKGSGRSAARKKQWHCPKISKIST